MQCPRCGRTHSGVCGIPAVGVRSGFGIRRANSQINHNAYAIQNITPDRNKMGTSRAVLEGMLNWGHQEQKKCLGMLKNLPHEIPEYTQLLERHDKLTAVIHQLKVQLAAKE